MFTGIVEDLGTLREVRRGAESARLRIATALPLTEVREGDSIALDGACLTVVRIEGDTFDVDAAVETLRKTTLGERAAGDRIHLERALRLSDRLGGHLVSGHVDGTGELLSQTPHGPALELTYRAPRDVARYLIVKGSVAVDGVSLTVNTVESDRFSVVLIPHTLEKTHLGARQHGARVNLEADLIGKYVERLLSGGEARGVDLELLRRQGYAK